MDITINWIFGIITTCAGGFITWSLKNLYNQLQNDKAETRKLIEEHASKAKEDTKNITAKFERLEERIPEKYTLKDDFYREINKLDSKLDGIREDITELNKNVSSLIALQEQILNHNQ